MDQQPIDYKAMQVGDRLRMPVIRVWEGQNQNLFREIQEYCLTVEPHPQFVVDTIREPDKDGPEYWIKRTR